MFIIIIIIIIINDIYIAQSEWAIPAFAFPAAAGTHLPTPEGWKAE